MRSIKDVDEDILRLNGVITHQTFLIEKPKWCANPKVACNKCQYVNKCKFTGADYGTEKEDNS